MTSAPTSHTVQLPSGTLNLWLQTPHPPLDTLLEYAVRQNPRRGFLFVSRVLGKHIPVDPAIAARTHGALAAALPALTAPPFYWAGRDRHRAGRGRVPRVARAEPATERHLSAHHPLSDAAPAAAAL